ncbi:MAG: SpoIIE family protein phosphatase, partial [Planctomycetes bacterium]|nr:SpoIIE family protein phosphatase [Planctomycetota bacterium]
MAYDARSAVVDFIRIFNKAARSQKMYSLSHPTVQKDVNEAFTVLTGIVAKEPNLSIGTREGVLVVCGKAVMDTSAPTKNFLDTIKAKNISSISFHRDMTFPEFAALSALLLKRIEDVMKHNRLDPALLEPFKGIKVQELEFGDGEGGGGGGGVSREEVLRLLEDNIKNVVADAASNPEGVPAAMDKAMQFFRDLAPMLENPNLPPEEWKEKLQTSFRTLAEGALQPLGVGGATQSAQQMVVDLPPQVQQQMFGRVFANAGDVPPAQVMQQMSPGFRGGLVANELNAGLPPPDQMRQIMADLAPNAGDMMRMLPAIAGGLTGTTEEIARKTEALLEPAAFQSTAELDLDAARANLCRLATLLPPEAQKALFGATIEDPGQVDPDAFVSRLSPEFRATLIGNEMKVGRVDPAALKEAFGKYSSNPEDIVSMVDVIAGSLGKLCKTVEERQEKMSAIFGLLPMPEGGKLPKKPGGNIILVDTDQAAVTALRAAFPPPYKLFVFADGKQAFAAAMAAKEIDCLVTSVRLPGMSGLDILAGLKKADKIIPAVITAANANFSEAFEISSYPKKKFFVKPVDPQRIRAAVEDLKPIVEIPLPTSEDEVEKFVEEEKEKAKKGEQTSVTEDEMKKAKDIQMRLIPQELPQIPGYDLGVYYQAALDVSGDYFDMIQLDDHRYGFIVGDVSGKSISGAMIMVMARSVFRMLAPMCATARDTVIQMNKPIHRDIKKGLFFSCCYGILDPEKNTVVIANAGQNPPVLYTAADGFSSLLDVSGMPLGLSAGAMFEKAIKEQMISLSPGDRLVFYTDGVPEAMNAEEEEWSEKKMLKVINVNHDKGSDEVVKALVEGIEAHRGEAAQSDDITILNIRFMPRQGDVVPKSVLEQIAELEAKGELPTGVKRAGAAAAAPPPAKAPGAPAPAPAPVAAGAEASSSMG